jgi:hypothetical protein
MMGRDMREKITALSPENQCKDTLPRIGSDQRGSERETKCFLTTDYTDATDKKWNSSELPIRVIRVIRGQNLSRICLFPLFGPGTSRGSGVFVRATDPLWFPAPQLIIGSRAIAVLTPVSPS